MNNLHIIGNGFDSAHGLDTRYWSLRTYIEQKDPDFLLAFEELYNIRPLDPSEPWYTRKAQDSWDEAVNYMLWSEFEKAMGNPDITGMLEMSECVTECMPTEGIQDTMDYYWQDRFGFVKKLQLYVKEWIDTIDTSRVSCRKKAWIESDDFFFTFNYTDVLERVYQVDKVMHIHGGIESVTDTPPLMGHCNAQTIKEHRCMAKEASEEFLEAEASIHNAVADYLEEIFKDTQWKIRSNGSFFQEIKDVDHVDVIGWSAGEVDIPYLEKIIKSIKPTATWTVYYYNDKAYSSLTSAFKSLGIVDKGVIEYVQSDNFWDK